MWREHKASQKIMEITSEERTLLATSQENNTSQMANVLQDAQCSKLSSVELVYTTFVTVEMPWRKAE